MKPVVLISTPFGPESHSGNWRTAARYAALLESSGFLARLMVGQGTEDAWLGVDAAIVLHARRSHAVATRARERHIPYAVVLTGTDIYGDLGAQGVPAHAAMCIETIQGAILAVALQQEAARALKERCAAMAGVVCPEVVTIRQATPWSVQPDAHREGATRCIMVGHVRAEKDPETGVKGFLIAQSQQPGLRLVHVGGSLDDALMGRLKAMQDQYSDAFQLQGMVSHDEVRRWMDQSDVLIHPSQSEGGALVLGEAVARGLYVLASDIPGNVGVLGPSYPGYFEVGKPEALSGLLLQLQYDQVLRARLSEATSKLRMTLCDPLAEARALDSVVQRLLVSRP